MVLHAIARLLRPLRHPILTGTHLREATRIAKPGRFGFRPRRAIRTPWFPRKFCEALPTTCVPRGMVRTSSSSPSRPRCRIRVQQGTKTRWHDDGTHHPCFAAAADRLATLSSSMRVWLVASSCSTDPGQHLVAPREPPSVLPFAAVCMCTFPRPVCTCYRGSDVRATGCAAGLKKHHHQRHVDPGPDAVSATQSLALTSCSAKAPTYLFLTTRDHGTNVCLGIHGGTRHLRSGTWVFTYGKRYRA